MVAFAWWSYFSRWVDVLCNRQRSAFFFFYFFYFFFFFFFFFFFDLCVLFCCCSDISINQTNNQSFIHIHFHLHNFQKETMMMLRVLSYELWTCINVPRFCELNQWMIDEWMFVSYWSFHGILCFVQILFTRCVHVDKKYINRNDLFLWRLAELWKRKARKSMHFTLGLWN